MVDRAFSLLTSHFSLRSAVILLAFSVCTRGADIPATQPATRPAVVEPRPILSPEQKQAAAVKLIDAFVAHLQADPQIAAAAKTAVRDGWAQHRKDQDPSEFLTAGVAIICEPYRNALQAIEKEDYAKVEAALRPLLEDKDAYKSLHAGALLARALVEEEKLEEAEALLGPLAAREKELMDKTFLEADVDFLLGYCQLSNLHYDEALASLQSFEVQHPDAPDRLRLPARQMLQELLTRRPESLGEVSDLMVYAGRRLSAGQAGKGVQEKQARVIELLNKLIKDAEDQENQQQSSSGGGSQDQRQNQPQGNPHPTQHAQESNRPGGKGTIGELHRSASARPGDEWGKMPPEERERVLQSLRRNFPSQYRQLVEQYYMQLAKER